MSSSSDSDESSSSDDERRHRKKSKKLKAKKDKKSKKHKKEKKHKSKKKEDKIQNAPRLEIPIAPTREINREETESFGPALPPHLFKKSNQENEETKQAIIGPVIPQELLKGSQNDEKDVTAPKPESNDSDGDDLNDCFGPLPSNSENFSSQHVELEQRALELKIAAMEGLPLGSSTDQTVREEWMLELPEVGLKGGLAALSNMKRTFYQGKERPDFSDRTSWTKTPQSETDPKKQNASTSSKMLKEEAMEKYERQRDAEQDNIAKKHKKKNKREESLVEIHQKKLKKEQKLKEKELKDSGLKPERRPFSRDVDLKLNKIDKNQTKQIVDKAKILDSKFSAGRAKYL